MRLLRPFMTPMDSSLCLRAMRFGKTDASSEHSLVERCRRRDVEAFEKVVDAYQHRILGFVKRFVRDSEDAADVSQEVFIRAFQNFEKFDGRCSLRTWLFRIAYNLCVDRSRRNERTLGTLHLDSNDDGELTYDVPDARWNPEGVTLDSEFFQIVDESLAEMSEKLRIVLLLHDREDMAYEEIAETLELPLGTVKSRLFLARNHLKKAVQAYVNGGI